MDTVASAFEKGSSYVPKPALFPVARRGHVFRFKNKSDFIEVYGKATLCSLIYGHRSGLSHKLQSLFKIT